MVVFFLIAGGMRGEVVENYFEGFESWSGASRAYDTGANPDFFQNGWSYIQGFKPSNEYGGYYNVNSSYSYEGSKALYAMYGQKDGELDLVVSPLVSGTVSFYARAYNVSWYEPQLELYRCSQDAEGNWVVGEKMTVAIPSLNNGYQQVTIELNDEKTCIGFRMGRLLIDNFAASKAYIGPAEPVYALEIADVDCLHELTLIADETNHFLLNYNVKVKNTGNTTLETYTLSVVNDNEEVLAQKEVTEPLQADATAIINLQANVEATTFYTDRPYNYFYVKESVTDTKVKAGLGVTVKAYLPLMKVFDMNPSEGYTLPLNPDGVVLNFGNTTEPVAATYYIKNEGSAPLEVTDITVPDGFTVSPSSMTLAKNEVGAFTLTFAGKDGFYGNYEGELRINAENVPPFSVAVAGFWRDPKMWYVTFEERVIPPNFYRVNKGWGISSNILETNFFIQNAADKPSSFIGPRLEVADTEHLTFEARNATEETGSLQVSYSANLTDWTVAADLTDQIGSNFRSFNIDNIPAGRWYVRFTGSKVDIDNIAGYTVIGEAEAVVLSGKVTSEAWGKPLKDATVNVVSMDVDIDVVTDEDGCYSLTLPANRFYDISVTAPGHYEAKFTNVAIAEEGMTQDVLLTVPHVSGYVYVDGQLASEGVLVEAATSDDEDEIFFTTQTAENGYYVLPVLAGRTYLIAAGNSISGKPVQASVEERTVTKDVVVNLEMSYGVVVLVDVTTTNGTPLENAVVTLTSGEVSYTVPMKDGKELSEPPYMTTIYGADKFLTYDLYVELEGYESYHEEGVSLTEGLYREIKLRSEVEVGIDSEELRVKSEECDNVWYDLTGRLVNSQFTNHKSQMPKGMYIVNGKKVLIK